MSLKKIKKIWKKIWYFIWEDNSVWSWLVNIILAFVLIKFIVYPGLGFMLGTDFPIVAVVSNSMEHNGQNIEEWWQNNGGWYQNNDITEEQFSSFPLKNGFYKGDIMVLFGEEPANLEVGDVIVFKSNKPDPIIHRIVKKWEADGKYFFKTKGDNNRDSIKSALVDETMIIENKVVGKAVLKIPLLGYIKIAFVEFLKFVGIVK